MNYLKQYETFLSLQIRKINFTQKADPYLGRHRWSTEKRSFRLAMNANLLWI